MNNFCFDNHIKYGYDNSFDYNFRKDKNQEYSLQFSKCHRKIYDYKKECIETAKLIKEQASNEDIWISYSGGIDSECVINAFLEAGIKFKVATIKFKNELNSYDLHFSRKFCNARNIKLHEVEIDLEYFLENELEEYAFSLNCNSPIFPAHLKLWDSIDGFIVAGHGDPIFRRIESTNNWYFQVKENEDTVYRYFKWRNRDGAPGFYAYTPEILLSFMYTPEFTRLMTFGHQGKVSGITGTKELILQRYFNTEKREGSTGFEKVSNLDKYYRNYLENKIKTTVWTTPVSSFIKTLWPDSMTGSSKGTPYLPDVIF